ncbi:unnamed protein product [Gongylonema pulchrum]|uniref:Secreted protein n=1 Tax=Gongylonema pulchrum TaxID=637853 RepID=A0A183EEG3_9BILA|nr:unnamed protein product [Gongylonema pulchrum]
MNRMNPFLAAACNCRSGAVVMEQIHILIILCVMSGPDGLMETGQRNVCAVNYVEIAYNQIKGCTGIGLSQKNDVACCVDGVILYLGAVLCKTLYIVIYNLNSAAFLKQG